MKNKIKGKNVWEVVIKNAIFISSKSKPAEGDNYPVKDREGKLLFEFEPLEKDNVFLLDASEAMNSTMLFPSLTASSIFSFAFELMVNS